MESLSIEIKSPAELDEVAGNILAYAGQERIFIFEGSMGAGKTTLIKALANAIGVEETVSSPTFSIVNEYEAKNETVYHFDFYRIKNLQEAYDIGYEEYFYSGSRCFIEWPEKIASLLPERYLKVEIEIVNEAERRMTVSKI
jgi:tRNA threonylcarbamoyladenosine biosynthesis protein TsaE